MDVRGIDVWAKDLVPNEFLTLMRLKTGTWLVFYTLIQPKMENGRIGTG